MSTTHTIMGNIRQRSIVDAVAKVFAVKPAEIRGRSRHCKIVQARQVALYIARKQGMALSATGNTVGGRDHTTSLHAVRRVGAALMVNTDLAEKVASAERLADEILAARREAMASGLPVPLKLIAELADDLGATNPAPIPETPASDQMRGSGGVSRSVPTVAEVLARRNLEGLEIGSRMWCEIQNCRWALAMGRADYRPSVEVRHV